MRILQSRSYQKVEQFSFTNETQAREVEHTIQAAARDAATAQGAPADGPGQLKVLP